MNNYGYNNSYNDNNMENMNEFHASDYNESTSVPPTSARRSMTPSTRVNTPAVSINNMNQSDMPETLTNMAYMPAYLKGQIGRWMRLEFLIGNGIEEKVGQLIEVGASYIILKMLEPATTMLCDIYSIKFITIIYDANLERLYTV